MIKGFNKYLVPKKIKTKDIKKIKDIIIRKLKKILKKTDDLELKGNY